MCFLNCCVLVATLLAATGRQVSAADEGKLNVDGIYGLGGSRLLRIEKDKFDVMYDSDKLGRVHVQGVQYLFQGTLRLTYFDGAKQVECAWPASVVNRHLWVGIMRHGRDNLWLCAASGAQILGRAGSGMPEGEVRWDLDAKSFSVGQVGVGGFSAEVLGKGEIAGGERIIGIMDEAHAAKSLAMNGRWTFDPHGEFVPGYILPTGMRLGDVGDAKAKVLGKDDLQKTADEQPKDWRHPRSYVYERIGEVMIAPWSVDLGPVGLLPGNVERGKATGAWANAEGKRVTVEPEMKESSKMSVGATSRMSSFPGGLPGKPSGAQIEAMESTLVGSGEDGGIYTMQYGWNCGMNHGDHPGQIYWFVTGEGKLVRILYPAYCDGGSGGWSQEGQLDIMERVKKK